MPQPPQICGEGLPEFPRVAATTGNIGPNSVNDRNRAILLKNPMHPV